MTMLESGNNIIKERVVGLIVLLPRQLLLLLDGTILAGSELALSRQTPPPMRASSSKEVLTATPNSLVEFVGRGGGPEGGRAAVPVWKQEGSSLPHRLR